MAAPSAVFVIFLGILAAIHVTVGRLLAAYLAAWVLALLIVLRYAFKPPEQQILVATGNRAQDAAPIAGAWKLGIQYIAVGWPIVLANTGYGVMQSADRLTVNFTRPIHDFAIYSLSQSTIYVPLTILIAVSRVALSYFARITHEGRAGVYRLSTRGLTLLWALLLPYYFAVEFVVRRFLPKYIAGLPAGRILLLSVLFLGLIQIIQLNTYSLERRQRQFFAGSLIAVAVAFVTAWIGSRIVGTLTAVAWSQVITAMLWWLGNEWWGRKRVLLRPADMAAVLASFATATVALYLAGSFQQSAISKAGLYYGLEALPLFFIFKAEVRAGFKEVWPLRRSIKQP
jgi:O-antigen/teichoic acid export membrane protein